MFHIIAMAAVCEDSDVIGHIAIWAVEEAEGKDSAWLRLRVGEWVVERAKARPPLLAFLFLIIFNILFEILRCISCVVSQRDHRHFKDVTSSSGRDSHPLMICMGFCAFFSCGTLPFFFIGNVGAGVAAV